MNSVCIWPDGTWCWVEEVEEYTFMSDDYALVAVPDTVNNIEIFVENYVKANSN